MLRAYTKKLIWTVTIFTNLFMLSCNKKSELEEPPIGEITGEIVGTWYLNKSTVEIIPTLASSELGQTEVEDGNGEYWVFSSTTISAYDKKGHLEDGPTNYIYDKKTNKLFIDDEEDSFSVITLTDKELVLFAKRSEGFLEVRLTMEFFR